MSITGLTPLVNTNTFGQWKDRTNQIIESLEDVVTIGDAETNAGNVVITGNITASNSVITDTITPLNSAADIVTISSNATIEGDIVVNNTVGGVAKISLRNLNTTTWDIGSSVDHTSFIISSGSRSLTLNSATGILSGANIAIDSAILPDTLIANLQGNVTGNITSTGTSSFTSIDINGGAIDGTPIGATSVSTVRGTTITATTGFSGNLTGDVTGNLIGNANTASRLITPRSINLTGAVSGSATFDGNSNITITTVAAPGQENPSPTLTVTGDASGSATFVNLGNATLALTIADDSHNHTIANIDGLQAQLNSLSGAISGAVTTGTATNIAQAAAIGWNQNWQNVARETNTVFRNLTGKPIMVSITSNWNSVESAPAQVSAFSATGPWVGIDVVVIGGDFAHAQFIVPNGHWYRNTGLFSNWVELR